MDLETSFDASLANIDLIEQMYEKYKESPTSIDPSWRQYFEKVDAGAFDEIGVKPRSPKIDKTSTADLRIYNLIQAYRTYGHLLAKFNPIATHPIEEALELKLETLGFKQLEMQELFPTCGLLPENVATLEKIISTLKSIYCDKIGIEYMGLQNPELETWLQQQIEPNRFKSNLTIEEKRMILEQLNRSELFESFLHTKYVGQKRFSLEGGETLIPMLAEIIYKGSALKIEEFVIGMAHRGRLNVLSNILNKSYADIFSEFNEGYIPDSFEGSGDVKYHKGFYSDLVTINGTKAKVVLTPNPSHLEAVNPVVEGQTKAKQIMKDDVRQEKVLPILVHGDAAISGQGIVYETLQLYKLSGYSTGGTIHIVINNQIGFTTVPEDGRSTMYCTDIAKSFGAPVFHVNAEDPEGCVYVTKLAIELRQKFHCEVFIDLNCYRKYGHNETDEPAFTQPLEYQIIRKKKPIRELYRDELIHQSVLEKELAEGLEAEFKQSLNKALKETQIPPSPLPEKEDAQKSDALFQRLETGVPKNTLVEIAEKIFFIPEGLTVHPKLANLIKERLAMVKEGEGSKPIDWGMGELLAYGTLLWQGIHVRLSGQDSCRGTFSHRHALWMDQVKERGYFPLSHLKDGQGRCDIINSPLSEFGALGFEFGYSLANTDALVIWEAQFGDFCNGAQVIIDQFISPAEQKWGLKFGLVMYLPHGYEGQGPEHSSGRIERFLQLCGNNNMQVVNPTTPAQLFHLLRRQVLRQIRKPLIVFTPKGLLRHPECVNRLDDFTSGNFQEILDDAFPLKNVKKLVFCSGRIYYDLSAARKKFNADDIAIIRIEQLYPLYLDRLQALIEKYTGFKECYWVQEEPSNMGAWDYLRPILSGMLAGKAELKYVGRPRSAATAVGSHALHIKEHEAILSAIFNKK